MTTPQPSRLEVNETGSRTLAAAGTIDSHTADALLERLRALGVESDVTLSLADVDFIDSSGLRTIVTAHQEFEANEARLTLRDPSDSVVRLLEITGLVEHLNLA